LGLGLGLGIGIGIGIGIAGCTPVRVNPNRLYTSSTLQAKWVGKTDDDSLTHLPRLEHELRLMATMARQVG
jgi:hypothetical protein